jgi:hypothetical protein
VFSSNDGDVIGVSTVAAVAGGQDEVLKNIALIIF